MKRTKQTMFDTTDGCFNSASAKTRFLCSLQQHRGNRDFHHVNTTTIFHSRQTHTLTDRQTDRQRQRERERERRTLTCGIVVVAGCALSTVTMSIVWSTTTLACCHVAATFQRPNNIAVTCYTPASQSVVYLQLHCTLTFTDDTLT